MRAWLSAQWGWYVYEKNAVRRYSHPRVPRHCGVWWCLRCGTKSLTGGHERDRKRLVAKMREIKDRVPATVMRRNDEGRWVVAHGLREWGQCIGCGAEQDTRGTGESGRAWYDRHIAEAKAHP